MGLANHPSAHAQLLSRSETFDLLQKQPWCDVLIVGGGIHGSTFAHLAALQGLRVVLFERGDYAQGTSSRSSKLAHGGVRYLEQFDFRQVFEGIRERENLLRVAPHLVYTEKFAAPMMQGEWGQRLLMLAGLSLYSCMALGKTSLPRSIPAPSGLAPHFTSAVSYHDGLMADTRIVIERILAARQEGAHCLNYTETKLFLAHDEGVEVRYTDHVSGKQGSINAGVVINTTGPWISQAGGLSTSDLGSTLRYSRGSHIIFDRPWTGPALILPIRDGGRRLKGRYYFITPHPYGTLVGTTEREVSSVDIDPLPSSDEVDEIFGRLAEDLPAAGLNRHSAFYCFAGIRALPRADSGRSVSAQDVGAISRRHKWIFHKGVLSLVGGKYTTAAWTCAEGFRMVMKLVGRKVSKTGLESRALPGAGLRDERLIEFRNACRDQKVPEDVRGRVEAQLGGRAVRLLDWPDGLELVAGQALKGQIRLAFAEEQSLTIEDVLRRRLELECSPGSGIGALEALRELIPSSEFDVQAKAYTERIGRIGKILGHMSEVAKVENTGLAHQERPCGL